MQDEDKNIKIDETITRINDTFGFVLSYGESKRLIPVGTFKLNKIFEAKYAPYTYGATSIRDIIVELKKYNNDDSDKEEDERIYMSFNEFLKLANSSMARKNKSTFKFLFGKYMNEENLSDAIKVTKAALAVIKDYDLEVGQIKTLEDLQACYISNGELLGTNYSIVPFYYNKSIDSKVKYADKDLKTKEHGKAIKR